MNALQHHAWSHLLATWRRRDDVRHRADGREHIDTRSRVEVARGSARQPVVHPR